MIKKNGFLLIDVLISVALILIISSLAFPSLRFLNKQLVFCELEKLNLAFHFMQQRAVSGNKNNQLEFHNIKQYSYLKQNEKLENAVQFGTKPGLKGPPSSPNNLIQNPISFPSNKVIFYSNGQISPGTVYIKDKFNDYQFALTVPISQISFMRKYYNNNGKWILT